MRIVFAVCLTLLTVTAADARHVRHYARLYATPYDHPAAAAGLYVTARPLVWFAHNVCTFAWSVAPDWQPETQALLLGNCPPRPQLRPIVATPFS
jgi:hypothetical protein